MRIAAKRARESLKGIHFQNTNLNGSCQKKKLTSTELLKDNSPPGDSYQKVGECYQLAWIFLYQLVGASQHYTISSGKDNA